MTTVTLTRAEDAYTHLASFQSGDIVDVGGRSYFQPGTVVERHDHADITRAYLVVVGCGVKTRVTVASLLAGKYTITSRADAKAGNDRYFDPAGYAMQTRGDALRALRAEMIAAGWTAESPDLLDAEGERLARKERWT